MNIVKINRSDEVSSTFYGFLKARREKYSHIDHITGKFHGYYMFLLTTLSSIMIIPLLFFLAANLLDVYFNLGIDFQYLIWPLITSISILLLWIPIIGQIYDRLEKQEKYWVVGLLVTLSTIGIIICCGFLLRLTSNIQYAKEQFQGSILTFSFLFPMMTIPIIKNEVYFTPSQDERRKLIYWESLGCCVVLYIFTSIPYWIKLGTDTCDCGSQCANVDSPPCKTCYEQCDSFVGENYFLISLISMVCIFGICNVLHYFIVKYRDNEKEFAPSAINNRLLDFFRNPLLMKTTILVFMEYLIFFILSFWFTYYIFYELKPEDYCTDHFSYFCTRGFWIQISILFLICVTIGILVLIRSYKYISEIWIWLALPLIVAGLYMAIFCKPQQWWSYIIILLFTSHYLSTIPNTKLIFTNAIYYDEYISGNAQANFGSSLYIGAVCMAFLFGLALEFSFFSSNFNSATLADGTTVYNYNDLGTGLVLTLIGITIFWIKYTYMKYDLPQFDKIQLAIERNNNYDEYIDRYTFYDPIDHQIIKKILRPISETDANIFYLLNNLNDKDYDKLQKRKFDKIAYENHIKIFLLMLLIIIVMALICIFYKKIQTEVVWAFILCFLIIPIAFIFVIFYFNSGRTAKKLKVYDDELFSDFFKQYVIWRAKFSKREEKIY